MSLKVNEHLEIRKLTKKDVLKYKSIRLLGMAESPYAFGSSVEEEYNKNDEFFYEQISNIFMIGGFYEGELVSTAGLYLEKDVKHQHKAGLWGVYTLKELRGMGVGRKVVDIVLDNLPNDIEQVFLSVWDKNIPALKIYKDLGFKEYGFEKNAIKWQGQYYNEIKMVKFTSETD